MRQIRAISGGDVNEAFLVETSKRRYFVKLNHRQPIDFFQFEADGLQKIASTKTIAVPQVYGIAEIDGTSMLWLEWVEGHKTKESAKLLGEQLAMMHSHEGTQFGYGKSSYVGNLQQTNALYDDWLSYYRDVRLKGQFEQGRTRGFICGQREELLWALLDQLHDWIPTQPKKSILHGDLWGGNWMAGIGGAPYLIDPSILYGDHEFELAFTELFGGFDAVFYEAYQSVFPLSFEYDERKEIYQLYYLLVHLNLFGEAYGGAIDRILKKYVKK